MGAVDMVGITLERSAYVRMPVVYAIWLDDARLVETFDSWWTERLEAGVHRDAFTPFAGLHFAPPVVQQCLRRLA